MNDGVRSQSVLGVQRLVGCRRPEAVDSQYVEIDRNQLAYGLEVPGRTEDIATQFLASYNLNPKSLVLVGYSDGHSSIDEIELTQTGRTFFLKIGYALGV